MAQDVLAQDVLAEDVETSVKSSINCASSHSISYAIPPQWFMKHCSHLDGMLRFPHLFILLSNPFDINLVITVHESRVVLPDHGASATVEKLLVVGEIDGPCILRRLRSLASVVFSILLPPFHRIRLGTATTVGGAGAHCICVAVRLSHWSGRKVSRS